MILSLAMILDALLGEPKWLWSRAPHPAVLAGRLIAMGDQHLNHGSFRKLKGAVMIAAFTVGTIVFTYGVLCILKLVFGPVFAGLVEIILIAILLAQRSLVDHVADVGQALARGLPAGRASVGRIVGRDTAQMERPEIIRAAIESASENLSDAVVAPVFWALIGGLPGIAAYKIINTADSMIGYKNEKYQSFGWASARLDDLVNWLPARATGFAILALSGHWSKRGAMAATAKEHRSVNAGWPEAAMAFALNIALAGPRRYQGVLNDEPFVHPQGRKNPIPQDIDATVRMLWQVWGAVFLLVVSLEILL